MEINGIVKNKYGTTEYWDSQTTLIPKRGEIVVYSDGIENNAPAIKVGDGKNLLNNLPLLGIDYITEQGELDFSKTRCCETDKGIIWNYRIWASGNVELYGYSDSLLWESTSKQDGILYCSTDGAFFRYPIGLFCSKSSLPVAQIAFNASNYGGRYASPRDMSNWGCGALVFSSADTKIQGRFYVSVFGKRGKLIEVNSTDWTEEKDELVIPLTTGLYMEKVLLSDGITQQITTNGNAVFKITSNSDYPLDQDAKFFESVYCCYAN